MCLLLAIKIRFPDHLYLLRGNHETSTISRTYGFFDECKRRYTPKIWHQFVTMFDCLPLAGIIDERIICMHGGLSPSMFLEGEAGELSNINKCPKGDVPKEGIMADLLWADPEDKDSRGMRSYSPARNRRYNTKHGPGWSVSDRGISYKFSEDIVSQFCDRHEIDLVCRAHQVVEPGYEFFSSR